MEVCKKNIILGMTLLVFCVLVEATGICKFARIFPPQRKREMMKNDTSQADKAKNKTNNDKIATTVGKTLSQNFTATKGKTFPMTYKPSTLAFTDHILEDTTVVIPDEHNRPTTSPGVVTDEHNRPTTSPATTPAGCGGYFDVSRAFFSSPNFPNNYGKNENCSWVIEAPVGQIVRLSFSSFSVIFSAACTTDSVKVYDGNSSSGTCLAVLCGHSIPKDVYTIGNQMFVSFTADKSTTASGFSATVTFVSESGLPKVDRRACGDTWTGDIGVLTSPNWPNLYDDNIECEYFIQGSSGQRVSFSFDNFRVGTSPPCYRDYVEIHDGASSNSTLLAKLCGDNLPGNYKSSGSNLYVKFYSNAYGRYPGFSASYTLW